jgi:hypothetical protein
MCLISSVLTGEAGTLGAGTNEATLSLYDTSGYFKDSAINNGVGGDPRLSYTPTTSGTYYLQASDLYDGTGTYILKATSAGSTADDFSATISTTGVLNVGGQISGNLELASDKDWFKIFLQAGTTYVFDLLGADGGGGTLGAGTNEATLSLYDTSGYFKDSAINNGVGGDPRLSYTPTTSGTYYLQASDLYDGTGTYILKATSAGSTADDFSATTSTTGVLNVGGQYFRKSGISQ